MTARPFFTRRSTMNFASLSVNPGRGASKARPQIVSLLPMIVTDALVLDTRVVVVERIAISTSRS